MRNFVFSLLRRFIIKHKVFFVGVGHVLYLYDFMPYVLGYLYMLLSHIRHCTYFFTIFRKLLRQSLTLTCEVVFFSFHAI